MLRGSLVVSLCWTSGGISNTGGAGIPIPGVDVALIDVGGRCSQLGLDALRALFQPKWFWGSSQHHHLSPDSFYISAPRQTAPGAGRKHDQCLREELDLEFDTHIPVAGTGICSLTSFSLPAAEPFAIVWLANLHTSPENSCIRCRVTLVQDLAALVLLGEQLMNNI